MSIQTKTITLRLLGIGAAFLIVAPGLGLAQTPDPGIHMPESGEVVYQNTLGLLGVDSDAQDNTPRWAVRAGTCARSTGTVAGNVDGFNDAFDWELGVFTASLDISTLDAGEYCFVLNTQLGTAEGNRLTQMFFIVDEFAKVGGTIGVGELGHGNSPTHALEGVVGDAGAAGIVGDITVNYRELGEFVTYEADSLSFRAAAGIGVLDPMAVADIGASNGARILVLDRDASDDFPRGAIVLRKNGAPSVNPYEIDNSEGSTGADSWVPMERGNNHTGIR